MNSLLERIRRLSVLELVLGYGLFSVAVGVTLSVLSKPIVTKTVNLVESMGTERTIDVFRFLCDAYAFVGTILFVTSFFILRARHRRHKKEECCRGREEPEST